jgi:hypothetical protein
MYSTAKARDHIRLFPRMQCPSDLVIGLGEVPDGYRALNDGEAIKVMVKPG